ncbi:MAG: helix-turn-helix transcriptional regulator [Candidatus Limnocylindrales bacterium]
MPSHPDDIEAVALLDEPVRRALYEWVVAQARSVGRDEAAAAIGVSRALAAFHLDRLVTEDLLVTEYRRLSGRTGPGAGRPAKLYRRGEREVTVSLPDRRYELAARLFAEAMQEMSGDEPPAALQASAARLGRELGTTARRVAGPRPSKVRRRAAVLATLAERGYEPRQAPAGEIRLGNCPFDALVDAHRGLVCGMNLALADGLLDGLGGHDFEARLDPQPGQCCVALVPITRTS